MISYDYDTIPKISYDSLSSTKHTQIQSYARGLVVRAVDPLTRGALRERMNLMGSSVNLRSFLDPPTPAGHTVKGYGLVSYRDSRKNSHSRPLTISLRRAMDRSMRVMGVDPVDYNYGRALVMDATAIISINGRRSSWCALLHISDILGYLRIL
jgi:hypothetical protein